MTKGFAVEIGPALAILESKHSEVANRWRQNAPDAIRMKRGLLFQKKVCELV
ncbi:MAG TPA: hypothetical protein VMO78_03210 [Rhizomicrobium sp.]|nr:hypothetical protein [Rhizomicrobium sp.]